ncbi:MAG: YfjD family protein [Actinomadura sp.]
MERVEVRPKPWRLGAMVVGALGFSVAGVGTAVYGEPFEVVIGLLAVVFFGGGMVLALPALARRRFVTLTLTPMGIEANGALAPWEDIEAVGVAKVSTKLFGIRLTRYDRYLASMSSTDRGHGRAAHALVLQTGRRRHRTDRRSRPTGLCPKRFVARTGIAVEPQYERMGSDVQPLLLDRRLPAFVTFVEEYRRSVQDDPELDSSAET